MTDELNIFGDWHELVDALKPKRIRDGRPLIKWKRKAANNRNLRTRKKNRELLRDRAKFVRTVVDGPSARSRPNAPKLTRPRDMAVGRWFGLLVAMGDADWTMTALCGLFERDMQTTQATVKRFMLDRGFAEKRVNPNAERYLVTGGLMAGRCTRPGKHRWLFRATARGLEVANGAEWRKPISGNRNRYKYVRMRQAKALAAKLKLLKE